MKKIVLFLSLSLIMISCQGSEYKTADSLTTTKEQQKKIKRYDVKSGIVTYKITISGGVLGGTVTGSGTESLYFKDWGALERIEEKSTQTTMMKIFGKKSTETTHTHTMSKLDNGESYHVDFDHKVIYLRRDLAIDLTKTFHPKADAGKVGKGMLEGVGGKKIGNEILNGYNCEIWDISGAKQWIYRGVPLKVVVSVMGIKTVKEAIKADFNTAISSDSFELPNYKIQKEEGFLNNDQFDEEMHEMDANMDKMSKMSYQEWKKFITTNDPEMQKMSDKELHQTYDMMQKMIKARKGMR